MKGLLWFLFVVLTVLPVVTYLVYYYRRLGTRRKQLLQTLFSLSLDSEYMLMRHGREYQAWSTCDDAKRLKDFECLYFNEDFRAGYSHRDYAWPVLLFTTLIAVGWALTFRGVLPGFATLQGAAGLWPAGFAFGFIGAYLACVLALIDGFRRYDLEPSLYYSVSFRIMFASFAAYVISRSDVFSADLTPLVAFGIGLFPLETTWTFITERAAKAIGAAEPEKQLGAELAKIQGLGDSRNRQKLIDVGVTTIQALATADPLLLFFQTTFPLRTVVDMVDKAILYLYLGDDVEKLRKHGINGVIELVALANLAERVPAYRPTEPISPLFKTIDTEKVITDVAQLLGQTTDELKAFIYNMYYDPMVRFIYEIWGRYLNRPVAKAVAQETQKAA
jgi:hypothetical protein